MGGKNGIAPMRQKQIETYYNSIPLMPENNHVFAMLDSFGETIWGGADKFSLVDINKEIVYVPQMYAKKNEKEKDKFAGADHGPALRYYGYELFFKGI